MNSGQASRLSLGLELMFLVQCFLYLHSQDQRDLGRPWCAGKEEGGRAGKSGWNCFPVPNWRVCHSDTQKAYCRLNSQATPEGFCLR